MTDLIGGYILFDVLFIYVYILFIYALTGINENYIIKTIIGILFSLLIISLIVMSYLHQTDSDIPDYLYDIVLYSHLILYIISIGFLTYVFYILKHYVYFT